MVQPAKKIVSRTLLVAECVFLVYLWSKGLAYKSINARNSPVFDAEESHKPAIWRHGLVLNIKGPRYLRLYYGAKASKSRVTRSWSDKGAKAVDSYLDGFSMVR
jgi:hypothetical protein